MEPKVNVKIELEGELKDKFDAIKKELGLEANTEVLRYLISWAAKRKEVLSIAHQAIKTGQEAVKAGKDLATQRKGAKL